VPLKLIIVPGPQGAFLNRLHALTKHFILYCEKFEAEGYLLLWPEFRNRSDITNPRLRNEFERFRAFLQEWASNRGCWSNGHKRMRIDLAYEAFQANPSLIIESPPLPEGFNYWLASNHNYTIITTSSRLRRLSCSTPSELSYRRSQTSLPITIWKRHGWITRGLVSRTFVGSDWTGTWAAALHAWKVIRWHCLEVIRTYAEISLL